MNVGYRTGISGAVMPDPWATHVQPTPKELQPYFSFIQRNVLEYTNSKVPLTRADYMNFVRFMASHGLSAGTMAAIAKQLLKEVQGQDRWKRAVILDKLQFDVFRHYYRKIKPAFSTFFLNSTAHFQHFYWRNMEPEIFTVKMSSEEAAKYESAILFGYQEMDRLVGKFIDLAGTDATLVFCTAISQQPYLAYEEKGGRQVYSPSKFEALVRFAGVSEPFRVAPVMAHQFHVYLESEQVAQRAESQLKALTVNGRQALAVVRAGTADFLRMPHLRQSAGKSAARLLGNGQVDELLRPVLQDRGAEERDASSRWNAVDSPSRSRALSPRRQGAAYRPSPRLCWIFSESNGHRP